jgi:hypothetical protein
MKKASFCITCLCILFLSLLLIHDGTAREDSTRTVRFEHGCKEYHYGIPFVYLQGTDYEVGLQYGALLKDELREVYEEFGRYKEQMMEKEIRYLPWYQRIFANLFGGMVLRHKINNYADQLSPGMNDQLKGMAEGSNLPLSFFRDINLFADLLSRGCSAFIIKNEGRIYHCYNDDTPIPVGKYQAIVHYSINGKTGYTSLGFIGGLVIPSGFNDSGLSFAENGNNNPKPWDKDGSNLVVDKNRLITESHNLKEVDSLVHTLLLPPPYGLNLSVASAKETNGVVFDLIGKTKAINPVHNFLYVAGRTISADLGKKSESIYASTFHNTARQDKFAELIDASHHDLVKHCIDIMSNSDFYHYSDPIPVHIESIHNYQTIQSVVYDLADSSVYFAFHTNYAAWSKWLKYNYITRNVSLYKEADPRLNSAAVSALLPIHIVYGTLDRRDSTSVTTLVNNTVNSHIENYFCLELLSSIYRDYYKLPSESMIYADKLIDKYPDVITGYYNKGRAFEAEKNYDEAIAEYMRALDCKIQCEYFLAETEEHLALAQYSLGKKDIAAEYATKALDIHRQYWIPDHLNERIQKLEKIKNKVD